MQLKTKIAPSPVTAIEAWCKTQRCQIRGLDSDA